MSHCSDKIFAHNSISAWKLCKDLQKFACFMVFGSKWGCLIMKALKNLKFYTYWLTLVYTVQTVVKYSERWLVFLTDSLLEPWNNAVLCPAEVIYNCTFKLCMCSWSLDQIGSTTLLRGYTFKRVYFQFMAWDFLLFPGHFTCYPISDDGHFFPLILTKISGKPPIS